MDKKNHVLCVADQQRLEQLYKKIEHEAELCVGFPWNSQFDYSSLFQFLNYPINNDGDPYVESNYHLNTHDFEREVLEAFADLTDAKPDSTWGYITSGGTEGNLYAIFLAQQLYPNAVFYCSKETFAIPKLLRCLRLENVIVDSHDDGRIDIDDLRSAMSVRRDLPAIVLANIGTTLKGAVDDLPAIYSLLDELEIKDRYVHADAALSGMILPFVDDAPPWNFSAGVDSVSISLHKKLGSPIPCGVVLANKLRVDKIAEGNDGNRLDTTILASRNAITPLFVWHAFRTVGLDGFRQRVEHCFEIADHAIERLQQLGVPAWRHAYSNTVVFPRPCDAITKKWQLFAQDDTAHLITMPHVSSERIDQFISELAVDLTADEQSLVASGV